MAMIFRHGFFHADPHPANILVLEQTGQIGLVDFGVAGKLTDADNSPLTRLFIDAVSENIDALPRRLADLGVRYPKEREEEFAAELREVYYRYYGASLAGDRPDPADPGGVRADLPDAPPAPDPLRAPRPGDRDARLGRDRSSIPDFNVFEVAKPYARELVLERFTPRRMALRTQHEARNYARMIGALPYQLHDTLEQVRDGQIEVGFRHEGLDGLFHRLDLIFNRLVVAIVAVGGIIGSAILGVFAESGPTILGLHVVSIVGFSVSTVLAMWLVWGVIRSGRI